MTHLGYGGVLDVDEGGQTFTPNKRTDADVMKNGKLTRVMVVEDHELFRVGLRQIVEETPGLMWVGECDKLIETMSRLRSWQPDVVLLDLNVNGENSLKIIRTIRVMGALPLIAVLTNHADEGLMRECESAGANAYWLKDISREDLVAGIAQLQRGKFVVNNGNISPIVLTDAQWKKMSALSPREAECMPLLASSLTVEGVAQTLQISINTVRNHRKSIYKKLGIHSKTELTLLCKTQGII